MWRVDASTVVQQTQPTPNVDAAPDVVALPPTWVMVCLIQGGGYMQLTTGSRLSFSKVIDQLMELRRPVALRYRSPSCDRLRASRLTASLPSGI